MLVEGVVTGSYSFKTGFYGLEDMPNEKWTTRMKDYQTHTVS